MLPTASEQDLLCRLVAGDHNAFDQLYHLYVQSVYANVHKIIREAATAEDVVQEVFIALWDNRKNIDTHRSVGGWLFVLSFNKSVNLLRQKLREEKACLHFLPKTEGGQEESDFEYQWQLLEDAMAQLSPQKRRVFELCKLQGKSYEETAAILRISRHTVKEYLSLSVSFIKDHVQDQAGSSVARTACALLITVL